MTPDEALAELERLKADPEFCIDILAGDPTASARLRELMDIVEHNDFPTARGR